MTDREKVIVGIEHCDRLGCSMCPYKPGGYSPMDCRIQLMRDALAILKEQEAVEPLAKEDDSYECICGAIVGWDELDASGIVQARLNYCPFCGKPITWEGR